MFPINKFQIFKKLFLFADFQFKFFHTPTLDLTYEESVNQKQRAKEHWIYSLSKRNSWLWEKKKKKNSLIVQHAKLMECLSDFSLLHFCWCWAWTRFSQKGQNEDLRKFFLILLMKKHAINAHHNQFSPTLKTFFVFILITLYFTQTFFARSHCTISSNKSKQLFYAFFCASSSPFFLY